MKTNYQRILMVSAIALLAASIPARAFEPDDQIESSARNSYVFKTFLKDDAIKTQSKDGVVTLSGTVKHESHKDLALQTVAHLPGVKSVDNQLEFKGISPGVNSDEFLSMKVILAIWFNRELGDSKPQVDVKNGVALLQGEVKNESQLERTAEYARDVEGIKGVINEMTVARITGEPAKTRQEKIDDASVTAQVMMALLTHRSTSSLKISVATNDGIITLGGEAQNAAEKDLVTKFVSDIFGVKGTINNMSINAPKSN